MYLLGVLIRSLDCPHTLQLARVITLVLILRNSIENRSVTGVFRPKFSLFCKGQSFQIVLLNVGSLQNIILKMKARGFHCAFHSTKCKNVDIYGW